MPIPIIDLFAGPGGLGEGFSSVLHAGERTFKIKLSIEMDEWAHQTLELRTFTREFPIKGLPQEYYDYLSGKLTRTQLFEAYNDEAEVARQEALLAELGADSVSDDEIDQRITKALGNSFKKWVLIGGPPCQAYSLVGRSRRKSDETFEKDKKHFLYKEYLRILAKHQPAVFVMENVKGLLSAKIKQEHIFDQILGDLQHPLTATEGAKKSELEYKLYPLVPTAGEISGKFEPQDFVIRSEEFGIPQARHRIIILGVRSDLKTKPDLLEPASEIVPIEAVIRDLPRLRSGISKEKEKDSPSLWHNAIYQIATAHWIANGDVTPELRDALIRAATRVGKNLDRGGRFIKREVHPTDLDDWLIDNKLKGVCNHETRAHIRADLHRYLFAAVFARENGRSPLLEDLPKALLPKHGNVSDALKETKFNDRFRVQREGRPSTTVVSHIAKDGHYYIHYDPTQCRSLTVREAARLQTFPDNYFFEGPRTQQYHQVGNAVPPLLAKQIAEVVANLLA